MEIVLAVEVEEGYKVSSRSRRLNRDRRRSRRLDRVRKMEYTVDGRELLYGFQPT